MINYLKWTWLVICEFLFAVWRDLRAAVFFVSAHISLHKIVKHDLTVAQRFRHFVKKHPNKPCFLFEDQVWTFQQVEDYSNKIAYLFQKKFGLKNGDCVSLIMENRPEYVCIWLGLSKIGVITALVNTNLRSESLLHTIKVAKAKCVVYGKNLESAVDSVKGQLDTDVQLIVDDSDSLPSNTLSLKTLLKDVPLEIVEPAEKITSENILLYIYTSGTTGLPKPAVIKESRYHAGALAFFEAARLGPEDVVMVSLPIYHGNGQIIGVGSAIISGATVCIRKKFSASNFWKECMQYKCTAFVYVGELCRFLVNQPPSPIDRQHGVHTAIGNGLRHNVWREFHARFNVKCIEFYAASEGNCTMINTVSKIGACGFVPLINSLVPILPVFVIKVDEQMTPIRDENGYCIRCKPGEKGLLIGIINNKNPIKAYNGYANNKNESNKKIVQDVFKKGQTAFNSGDLMMYDNYGYMYFCDRLGDTFRWRGENVATIEVENVISKNLNQCECAVYGVEVPGQEGKAGMAAIKTTSTNGQIKLDLNHLAAAMKDQLPAYAKPLFIRIVDELELTGSFKTKKNKLVEESYNLNLIKDNQVFYFDAKSQSYAELTREIYENILNGNIRL